MRSIPRCKSAVYICTSFFMKNLKMLNVFHSISAKAMSLAYTLLSTLCIIKCDMKLFQQTKALAVMCDTPFLGIRLFPAAWGTWIICTFLSCPPCLCAPFCKKTLLLRDVGDSMNLATCKTTCTSLNSEVLCNAHQDGFAELFVHHGYISQPTDVLVARHVHRSHSFSD